MKVISEQFRVVGKSGHCNLNDLGLRPVSPFINQVPSGN